jgi:hypothetical protein
MSLFFLDTKGKSFLNAAPPIPSYERSQMSNVIETHKPDVWVHLWWALVWHKNLNFNNLLTSTHSSTIPRYFFDVAGSYFRWINSANQKIQQVEWDFHVIFRGYLRWISCHISWSPDPTSNFETTNSNFHYFFCPIRTSFIISFCLYVVGFFWLVNKFVKIQDS